MQVLSLTSMYNKICLCLCIYKKILFSWDYANSLENCFICLVFKPSHCYLVRLFRLDPLHAWSRTNESVIGRGCLLVCICVSVCWVWVLRIVQQDLHDNTLSLTPLHWFGFQHGSNSFIEYLEMIKTHTKKSLNNSILYTFHANEMLRRH